MKYVYGMLSALFLIGTGVTGFISIAINKDTNLQLPILLVLISIVMELYSLGETKIK